MIDTDPKHPRLGEVLVAAGAVKQSELKLALAEQSRWGSPLGMTLVRLGFLDEVTLIRALASQLNLPVVSLRGKRINNEILELVPVATAEKYRCLPLLLNSDGAQQVLYLGVENPTDTAALEEISAEVGMAVQPVVVSPTDLDECIHRHYHWDSSGGVSNSTLQSTPLPIEKSPSESPLLRPLARSSDLFSSAGHQAEDGEVRFGEFVDPEPGIEARLELETELETESGDELSMPESLVEPEPEIPRLLEFAESTPETVPAKPAGASADDSMLRAIAQLLIEKGVFTRDELVDRLRTAAREDP